MAKFLSLIIACHLLIACQSSPVVSDYDTNIDFSEYRYYQWDKKSKSDDPLMNDRLQKSVSDHLATTLLYEASADHPAQIIIQPTLKSQQRTQEPDTRGSIGMGGGGGSTLFGVSLSMPLSSETIVKDINIMISFINIKTKKTLWQGSYAFTIDADDPDAINQKVDIAVKEILAQYPPQPGQ